MTVVLRWNVWITKCKDWSWHRGYRDCRKQNKSPPTTSSSDRHNGNINMFHQAPQLCHFADAEPPVDIPVSHHLSPALVSNDLLSTSSCWGLDVCKVSPETLG